MTDQELEWLDVIRNRNESKMNESQSRETISDLCNTLVKVYTERDFATMWLIIRDIGNLDLWRELHHYMFDVKPIDKEKACAMWYTFTSMYLLYR